MSHTLKKSNFFYWADDATDLLINWRDSTRRRRQRQDRTGHDMIQDITRQDIAAAQVEKVDYTYWGNHYKKNAPWYLPLCWVVWKRCHWWSKLKNYLELMIPVYMLHPFQWFLAKKQILNITNRVDLIILKIYWSTNSNWQIQVIVNKLSSNKVMYCNINFLIALNYSSNSY